jgi:predicted secreted protein
MHSFLRKRNLLFTGLFALAVAAVTPSTATADATAAVKPKPGAKARGFRLFARWLGAVTINRIYCGLAGDGEVC